MITRTLWLARNNRVQYGLYPQAPYIEHAWGDYVEGPEIRSFCAEGWHRLTGIRLKKHQMVKCQLRKTKRGFSLATIGKAMDIPRK